MQIEVWADLVCPWCFIGKRRLGRAIAERGLAEDVEVLHRAFQLNPAASTQSEPTTDYLARKYGITREQALDMMSDVTEVAATEGLRYRLDRTMTGSTVDAHRLVLWAQDADPRQAQQLLDSLYVAYFENGRSIFGVDDLTAMAADTGLDPGETRDMLNTSRYVHQVAQDQDLGRHFGANGVPFFVIDRALGISGAQPFEVFLSALDQARERIA